MAKTGNQVSNCGGNGDEINEDKKDKFIKKKS